MMVVMMVMKRRNRYKTILQMGCFKNQEVIWWRGESEKEKENKKSHGSSNQPTNPPPGKEEMGERRHESQGPRRKRREKNNWVRFEWKSETRIFQDVFHLKWYLGHSVILATMYYVGWRLTMGCDYLNINHLCQPWPSLLCIVCGEKNFKTGKLIWRKEEEKKKKKQKEKRKKKNFGIVHSYSTDNLVS